MIEQIVENFHTNIYLSAAKQLDYEISILDHQHSLVVVSHNANKLKIYKNNLDINDLVQSFIGKNKALSNNLLQKELANFVPAQLLVNLQNANAIKQALVYCQQKNFQVVIKPIGKSLGYGVTILPQNEAETKQALQEIKNQWSTKYAVIENYLSGDHEYRVLVLNGEIIDIVERIAAHVTGDGQSTVQALIDDKSEFRIRYGFDEMLVDKVTKKHLQRQGYSLDTVLPEGQTAYLRLVCNFDPGGDIVRVELSAVQSQYLQLFSDAARAVDVPFLGIDVIAPNITQSWQPKQIGFNEINHAPMPHGHYFADLLEGCQQPKTAKKVLQKILE